MHDVDRAPTIGDYGLIGDCHTAALVSRDGSIDWCCLPRFDSGRAFGRLLDPTAGHCQIAPADRTYASTQRYIEDTLVLETTFHGPAGVVRLLDSMVMEDGDGASADRRLVRMIEGRSGSVELRIQL